MVQHLLVSQILILMSSSELTAPIWTWGGSVERRKIVRMDLYLNLLEDHVGGPREGEDEGGEVNKYYFTESHDGGVCCWRDNPELRWL